MTDTNNRREERSGSKKQKGKNEILELRKRENNHTMKTI